MTARLPVPRALARVAPAVKASVTWPEVLRALGRDSVRSYALDQLKRRGFSPVFFGAGSGARPTREAVADALSATEGWLELEHPKYPERKTTKTVRRRLEVELWP
jgi:hypothetical protein